VHGNKTKQKDDDKRGFIIIFCKYWKKNLMTMNPRLIVIVYK
jgi:hypothetical protein